MTRARDDLAVEYVRSAFTYDANSGDLFWKDRADQQPQWNGKFQGRRAGTINDRGYVIVAIGGRDYRAHRLAWAIVTGEWPLGEMDHVNLNKADNRWANLRLATHSQNNQNKRAQSNNTSGFKGVSFCRVTRSWVARMKIGERYEVLGRSAAPEGARDLYQSAAAAQRGEFHHPEHRS